MLASYKKTPLIRTHKYEKSSKSSKFLGPLDVFFDHVIRILVSESSFLNLRYSTVVSSNVSIRMP